MEPIVVDLTRETIDKIFEEAEDQGQYFVALYRAIYPNWDDIETVTEWPKISKETGVYIMQKAIDFDKVHHPDVINGGLWMNKGFSVDSLLMAQEWKVRQSPYTLKEKKENDGN
jgi:hypothetical protein